MRNCCLRLVLFTFFFIVFTSISIVSLFAQEVLLSDTQVQEDSSSIQIEFTTNKSIPIECYDLANPPQIIIDFMGEIYTNGSEIVAINKDSVKQYRIIKGTRESTELDKSYYSIDFIIVDLKEPLRYDFTQGLSTAILMISKPGKLVAAKLPKKKTVAVKKSSPPTPPKVLPIEEVIIADNKEIAPKSVVEKKVKKVAKSIARKKKIRKKVKKEDSKIEKGPKAVGKGIGKGVGTVGKKIKSFFSSEKKKKEKKIEAKRESKKKQRLARSKSLEKKKAAKKAKALKKKKAKKIVRKRSSKVVMEDVDVKLEQAKKEWESAKQLVKAIETDLVEINKKRQAAKKLLSDSGAKTSGIVKKKDGLQKEFEDSHKLAVAAKNKASEAWEKYSVAKRQLSKMLQRNADKEKIEVEQAEYDKQKDALEKSIKIVDEAKSQSNAKYIVYSKIKKEYAEIQDELDLPGKNIFVLDKKIILKEKQLKIAEDQLNSARENLVRADRAYKQRELEKADAEYRKSLMEIDRSFSVQLDDLESESEVKVVKKKSNISSKKSIAMKKRAKAAKEKEARRQELKRKKEEAKKVKARARAKKFEEKRLAKQARKEELKRKKADKEKARDEKRADRARKLEKKIKEREAQKLELAQEAALRQLERELEAEAAKEYEEYEEEYLEQDYVDEEDLEEEEVVVPVVEKPLVKPKRRKSKQLAAKKVVKRESPRVEMLESAIELRNAGLEMQRNGDFDRAMRYYQQALMSDTQYVAVHNDLGILYEQKGLDEKAKNEYLKALKINPYYIKAHSNLALLYEKQGDYNKSYYHWKQRAELGEQDNPWTAKARLKLKEFEQRR